MSEFTRQHQASSAEKLRLLEFSFITPPNSVKAVDPERISELDKLPFDQRVIETTYYALELSARKLQPFGLANSRLEEMVPGTQKAIRLIDDVIIATAVQAEIAKSFSLYDPIMGDAIVLETAKFTPDNVGWLKAIQRMRNASERHKRIGYKTGRWSEAVARLTIARQEGIQISYLNATTPTL